MISLRFYDVPSHPAVREDDLDDNRYDYYEREEIQEIIENRNKNRIAGEILERFRITSIVRYIEAWNGVYKVKREFIMRALHGSPEFEKAIAGLFGAFNKKVFEKSGDEWFVVDFGKLYPRVKRLPQEGVESIRTVFRQRKSSN
jgi:hypothetical protein